MKKATKKTIPRPQSKPKTSLRSTSKSIKSTKKTGTQIIKNPINKNEISKDQTNQLLLDLKSEKLTFNSTEKDASLGSEDMSNKDQEINELKKFEPLQENNQIENNDENINKKLSMAVNSSHRVTNKKGKTQINNKSDLQRRNSQHKKKGGTVRQTFSGTQKPKAVRNNKKSLTATSNKILSNKLLSNKNSIVNNIDNDNNQDDIVNEEDKHSDTNISDISPIKNVPIDPKESIKVNKEDEINFEDNNNFNNDIETLKKPEKPVTIRSATKNQTVQKPFAQMEAFRKNIFPNDVIFENPEQNENEDIVQQVNVINYESPYKNEPINMRGRHKSRTVNLKSTSAALLAQKIQEEKLSVINDIIKENEESMNDEEDETNTQNNLKKNNVQNNDYSNDDFYQENINISSNKIHCNKSVEINNTPNKCKLPYKPISRILGPNQFQNLNKQICIRNIYHHCRSNSSPFKSFPNSVQLQYSNKKPYQRYDSSNNKQYTSNEYTLEDLIALSLERPNTKIVEDSKCLKSITAPYYKNGIIYSHNIDNDDEIKRRELKDKFKQLKRNSEIKSKKINSYSKSSFNISSVLKEPTKNLYRSQSSSNIYSNKYFNRNNNNTNINQNPYLNFEELKFKTQIHNSNSKLNSSNHKFSYNQFEPKKQLSFNDENDKSYHLNKLKNDLQEYNNNNSILFKKYHTNHQLNLRPYSTSINYNNKVNGILDANYSLIKNNLSKNNKSFNISLNINKNVLPPNALDNRLFNYFKE